MVTREFRVFLTGNPRIQGRFFTHQGAIDWIGVQPDPFAFRVEKYFVL